MADHIVPTQYYDDYYFFFFRKGNNYRRLKAERWYIKKVVFEENEFKRLLFH